jgi:hypothetical protein
MVSQPEPRTGADGLALDDLWTAPFRSTLAGAAVSAAVHRQALRLTELPPGPHSAGIVWHYAPRLMGLRATIVEAGTGASPAGDRRIQAEQAAARLAADCRIDVLSLRIADGERRPSPPAPAGRSANGAFIMLERRTGRPEILPIGPSYAAFLDRLGHDTRRNMRRTRRKAEADGLTFTMGFGPEGRPGAAELDRIGALTAPDPRSPRRIAADEQFVAGRPNSWFGAIRGGDGALLSYASGFMSGGSAFLVHQLNDKTFRQHSLSLTNRSYLIEGLVDRGAGELIFPKGCTGLLRAACLPVRGVDVIMIRRSLPGLAMAGARVLANPSHPLSMIVRAWLRGRVSR